MESQRLREKSETNPSRILVAAALAAACNSNIDRPVTTAQGEVEFALLNRFARTSSDSNNGVIGTVTPTRTGISVRAERRDMNWDDDAQEIIMALERGSTLSQTTLCSQVAGVRCETNTDGSLNEICFATRVVPHDSFTVTTTNNNRTNTAHDTAACRVNIHQSWIHCVNDSNGQIWMCAH